MPIDRKVNGIQQETGAPVVSAATMGELIAVTSGDGNLRVFQPDRDPLVFNIHEGVILSMATESQYLLTGGEDGRFLRVALRGEVEEIARFGSKWVDCVASDGGYFACSSGRVAYVWSPDRSQPVMLEHQSTVGGLAFNAGRNQLAVAHYGGVTIWTRRGIK